MYMLLLLAVLLIFLLEPAAAASPIVDYSLCATPMEPFFSDAESVLNPICQYCAIPFLQCIHAMPPVPYAAARMYNEPQAFQPPIADVRQTAPDLAPIYAYLREHQMPQLMNENVRNINANETTIQPQTVQAHIEDTYTPGDRLSKPRKTSHRRQAARSRGYPCSYEGCEKTYDRACELNRHKKTHLDSSQRPHRCNLCNEGFLYPKDLARHQRRHIEQPSVKNTFHCSHPGCDNLEGFSRRDNLLRHQRKRHPFKGSSPYSCMSVFAV
ncbi:hypothetical protein BDU57DRAFT_356113 [Ampelomyces quisqualis]|uniref:C2H2-type domain-containing protein n=1 Tax=Ampelomyces quisqualis TaxID=50730 RepID=A0A6A5QCW9_AMPQU|nr:hypothetical protein BDU57DRAFT_356113 [Ampelomyces quisqualis]